MNKQQSMTDHFDTLMSNNRWCYVIPREEGFVEGHGYRVSIVIEHQAGHYPTGDLNVLSKDKDVVHKAYKAGGKAPWFWGMTYEEACENCRRANQELGYNEVETTKIVSSTMGGYKFETHGQ